MKEGAWATNPGALEIDGQRVCGGVGGNRCRAREFDEGFRTSIAAGTREIRILTQVHEQPNYISDLKYVSDKVSLEAQPGAEYTCDYSRTYENLKLDLEILCKQTKAPAPPTPGGAGSPAEDPAKPWPGGAPPATAPPSPSQCRLNSDCAPGLVCDHGSCLAMCREDRDCASGQRCDLNSVGNYECLDGARAPSAGAGPATSSLPEKLDFEQIKTGLGHHRKVARDCGLAHGDHPKDGRIRLQFVALGASGRLESVSVVGEGAGSPLGKCVVAAMSAASFPKFSQTRQKFQYVVKLRTNAPGDAELLRAIDREAELRGELTRAVETSGTCADRLRLSKAIAVRSKSELRAIGELIGGLSLEKKQELVKPHHLKAVGRLRDALDSFEKRCPSQSRELDKALKAIDA